MRLQDAKRSMLAALAYRRQRSEYGSLGFFRPKPVRCPLSPGSKAPQCLCPGVTRARRQGSHPPLGRADTGRAPPVLTAHRPFPSLPRRNGRGSGAELAPLRGRGRGPSPPPPRVAQLPRPNHRRCPGRGSPRRAPAAPSGAGRRPPVPSPASAGPGAAPPGEGRPGGPGGTRRPLHLLPLRHRRLGEPPPARPRGPLCAAAAAPELPQPGGGCVTAPALRPPRATRGARAAPRPPLRHRCAPSQGRQPRR